MQSRETTKPQTDGGSGLCGFDQLGRQINPILSASPAPAQGASRILVQIPRGQRDIIRVTEHVINGKLVYDLRRHRPYKDMWRDTPIGINLSAETARAIALAILAALPEVST